MPLCLSAPPCSPARSPSPPSPACPAATALGPTLKDSAYAMERSRAGLVRKEITLADGTHIAYLEGGSGAPLVLVHGFGADKDNFTRIARYLVPHYRVIVPDLVGFGESSHRADVDYHYAAQAQRAARLHAGARPRALRPRRQLDGRRHLHELRRAASAGGGQPVADRRRGHRRGAAQRARDDHHDHGHQPADDHEGKRLRRVHEVRHE